MRWLCLALAACGAATPARSEDAFTASAAERLHARHPTWSVAPIGRLLVVVAEPNGQTSELPLDEPWKRCQDPASCEAALADFVAKVAPGGIVVPPEQPSADERLAPWVRGKGFLPGLERPLAGDLVVVYVVGTPPATRFVRPQDLAGMKLDEAGLDAAARRTVEASLDPLPPDPPATISVLARGNDLEASRLLLHDSWAPIAARITGPLLVTAPGADTVLYTDGSNPTALPAMRKLAADLRRRVLTPLPPVVLAWTPTGWDVVP